MAVAKVSLELGAWLLACAAMGCDASTCRDSTLLLSLDYHGVAADADTLTLDLTVGGRHQRYQRARQAGNAHDTLEVRFASYPADATVVATAVALAGDHPVGAGEVTSVLGARCGVLSLTLSAGVALDDGGHPLFDFAGLELGPGPTPDLAGGDATDDLQVPPPPPGDLAGTTPDLAHAPTQLVFVGETPTERHPNGAGAGLVDAHCPAGYAIIGFAFAMAGDNATVDRVDAMCAQATLTPASGGGYTVGWNPFSVVTASSVGTNEATSISNSCSSPTVVNGFGGRAGASALNQFLISCAPIQIGGDHHPTLGTQYDGTLGVGSKTAGTAFGPVHCPANQVATSLISDGSAGSPPVAFGFGCSAMALQ